MRKQIEEKIMKYIERMDLENPYNEVPDLAQSIIDMVIAELYVRLEDYNPNMGEDYCKYIDSLKQD